MTKIFEALERASQERKPSEKLLVPSLPESYPPMKSAFDFEEEMLGLYKNIEALLPGIPHKLILFAGTQEGEGTSTIVREFAKLCANRIGKSVLLIDGDRSRPSQHRFFDIQSEYGWVEAVQNGKELKTALCQVGNTPLFVSPSCNSATYTPEIFDPHGTEAFWKKLIQQFHFVLIDSSPLSTSPDGLAFAPRVDGVVMVVEAERTRWRVAESWKDKITKVGGNVIGVVFNKRRYYIPDFVYKRI